MARVLTFIIAMAFVSQATSNKPQELVGKLLTQGVGKEFEKVLNNTLKMVKEVHEPFIKAFKEKGSVIPTQQELAQEDILYKFEACVGVPQHIGQLAGGILNIYYTADRYFESTEDVVDNSVNCLQNKAISSATICLMQEAKIYGDSLEEINDNLTFTVGDIYFHSDSIVKSFNDCLETNLSTLSEITKFLLEQYKSEFQGK